jgi:phosphoglycolate phosphatase
MRALGEAIRNLLGFDFSDTEILPDGKTDPVIVRELFQHKALEPARWPEIEARIWEEYPKLLASELQAHETNPSVRHELLPGVRELLDLLHINQAKLGLITGNLESTARIKLERFGLNSYFPFGAFASDADDRNHLGPIALARLKALHPELDHPELASCSWIVGDTPRDIHCARACGARVVAVASGNYSLTDLQSHSPDVCLPDLSETERILSILLS